MELISDRAVFIGLYYPGGPDINACGFLSECSGLLKWLDDGSDFVYDSALMDDLEIEDNLDDHNYVQFVYWYPSSLATPVKYSVIGEEVSASEPMLCQVLSLIHI